VWNNVKSIQYIFLISHYIGCVPKKSLGNAEDMKRCCTFRLGSSSKQTGDEHHMIRNNSFAYDMQLTLFDHVHHFKALQGLPRGLERKKAHPELDQMFHEAMILLDDIVEVFTLTQFAKAGMISSTFSSL